MVQLLSDLCDRLGNHWRLRSHPLDGPAIPLPNAAIWPAQDAFRGATSFNSRLTALSITFHAGSSLAASPRSGDLPHPERSPEAGEHLLELSEVIDAGIRDPACHWDMWWPLVSGRGLDYELVRTGGCAAVHRSDRICWTGAV